MAASLSRPDPSSPASVAEAGFSTGRRGYHQDEVRAFLTSVAAELGRLQERERQLEAELRDLRSAAPPSVELDDETVTQLLGEETLRVLQTARESASQIKIRAEESAARILRDANDEANRLRQDAEVEAARKRQDASSDAEAEVALAKQQGREMVNEARAYRERVLADLERRTKLARQQIEELLHGRDRLLQVFERARLVAVDVTSDLAAVQSPDELVNFSPTTGPVPLMVPASRLDASPSEVEPADEAARPAAPTDEQGDETDGTGEPAADEGSAAEAEVEEAETEAETEAVDSASAPRRDANVVSLFRGRAAHDAAGDDTVAEEADGAVDDGEDVADDADDGADRPDVGGIFARLRSEVPTAAGHVDEDTDDTTDDETLPETSDEAGGSDDTEQRVEPTAFTRRDEAIVPLIVAAARKLKRVLADEQNGVLDTLRQKEPVTSLDQLLPDTDTHVGHYAETLADELLGAAAAGAVEVGASDTASVRRKLDKAGALEAAISVLRSDLITPLRDRLERSIGDGAGDNEDITKRVRAVYREWKTQHIDDQLDDVFRSAHGRGLAVTVEPGTPMVWTIDPSEPACPDCEDNSLAGPGGAGDAYPTGHTSAPAHPGCRCLTVPVSQ